MASKDLIKIRTITYFLASHPKRDSEWETEVRRAAEFLQDASEEFEGRGYEIQTLRIATRALSIAAGSRNADETLRLAHMLEALAGANGLTFLNLGSSSEEWLLDGTLTTLGSTLQNTSFSFAWQSYMGVQHAKKLASSILKIAQLTEGSGNFRFGVSFNCESKEIPFFPGAHPGEATGFAIGTENSAVLHKAFKSAASCLEDQLRHGGKGNLDECVALSVRKEMTSALIPIEEAAQKLAEVSGVRYIGIDSSIVPALEGPALTEIYELLGLGPFGGPGTLAISERITAALKSLPMDLCGFSGLMLPVTEDAGLAEAAAKGAITWQTLLFNSAVCGVGLDTLPIPGIADDTPPAERERLIQRVTGMLLDTAALSSKLSKPLLVRLLPVPGARAGDFTAFNSPYLVESRVMTV